MLVEYKNFEKLPKALEGEDLYKLINADSDQDKSDIDKCYSRIIAPTFEQHAAWKVLRDIYYRKLYDETFSISKVIDAGFFVDRLSVEMVDQLKFDSRLFTTPVHKIQANLEPKTDDLPAIVLLSTGAFSPVHYGHVSMMETAKRVLESQGRQVVGGYLSPSHDHYVSKKYDGSAALSSSHRLHLCQRVSESSNWLMADPWESEYLATDINFTDVISRLKSYAQHFVGAKREIEVFYVYGADNAGFVNVLKFMDGGVCVSRSSDFNERPQVFVDASVIRRSDLLFIRSDDPASEFSSTAVRSWKPQLMPKVASEDYFGWRKEMMSIDLEIEPPPKNYIIRDDIVWSLKQYYSDSIPEKALLAASVFKRGLKEAIETAFKETASPDKSRKVQCYLYSVDKQYEYAKEIEASRPTLNLDVCTNDNGGVNFSRRFELSDGQFRPYELIARPGFPEIGNQIANIKSGEYLFLDDDIASGATLNLLIGMLPEDIKITAIQTLFNYSRRIDVESNRYESMDVVDTRDFLVGSHSGGLVASSPNGKGYSRAPYMLPFVNPFTRASIPLSSSRKFSRKVWELNNEFFSSIDEDFKLGDSSPEFRNLMEGVGFSAETPITKICQFYAESQSNILEN
jgi:glycerol-3-phosphate cytidylyltransferase-like family protein